MVTYAVEELDDVAIDGDSPLAGMKLMSPFVWRENGARRMLLRGVPEPWTSTSLTGVMIEDDLIALYFSIEDRALRRALIRAFS